MSVPVKPGQRFALKWWQLTFIVSLYFLLVLNASLLRNLWLALPAETRASPLAILCVPLACFGVLFAFFSALSARVLLKPLFSLFLLIGAACHLASWKYGVVFNTEMLRNILETHRQEVAGYFSWMSLLQLSLLGGLPIVLLLRAPIEYPRRWQRGLRQRLGAVFATLLLTTAWGWLTYDDLAFVTRKNSGLHRQVNPLGLLQSGIRIARAEWRTPRPLQAIATDAQRLSTPAAKPVFMVLVIGETARAANYPEYGYTRNTTPYTDGLGLVSVPNVRSCGTSTSVSLPCMFSDLGQKNFSRRAVSARENALDVLMRAGVAVYWKDNDNGCKGVCARLPPERYTDLAQTGAYTDRLHPDEVLLDAHLGTDNGPAGDRLLVLHLRGSHGPNYHERYGENDRLFTPDCARADVENCDRQALINTYDNSIAYTDKVLAQLVERLRQLQDRYHTAMMYLSDHGESLGEHGVYLHGLPYAVAPREQTEVPWMLWLSPGYAQHSAVDMQCLPGSFSNKAPSHDALFHTLLGSFQIQTKAWRAEQDLLAACRNTERIARR